MPTVDATRSPFYAWLDCAGIRQLIQRAQSLSPGERLVLIKGLIPGLVEDMGDAAVHGFLEELDTKAQRYTEAVANPGRGGATRRMPSERLGGPVPGREAYRHLPGTRNPRRPGGRMLERRWEAAAWEEMADVQDTDVVYDASVDSFPASDPPAWIGMRLGQPRR